jgi:aryl-alcohol dehydrogenase-like predicted oxidoreductase
MEYRRLGKTGVQVSEISLGPGNSTIEDDTEGVALITAAFDAGVNLYDTANFEKDGKVEEWLGAAFHERREQVVIATKFSGDGTRKHIVRTCEQA